MRPHVLLLAIVITLWTCQVVNRVRVQNDTDSPITLAYKIRPMGYEGVFFQQAIAKRCAQNDTLLMNPADSLITFTLQPGQLAILGDFGPPDRTRSSATMKAQHEPQMNLYWLRLMHNGTTTTYTPDELLLTAKQEMLSLILLSEMR